MEVPNGSHHLQAQQSSTTLMVVVNIQLVIPSSSSFSFVCSPPFFLFFYFFSSSYLLFRLQLHLLGMNTRKALSLMSLLPSHSSFFSFLFFLVVTLFLSAFLTQVSNQNISRETQETKRSKLNMTFTVSHLPTFYFLLNAFFFFFTKVTNGQTNQRGLSATLSLFLFFVF